MVTVRKGNNRILWIAAALLLLTAFYGVRLVTRTKLPIRVAEAAEEAGNFSLSDSMYAEASAEAPTNAQVQLHYASVLLRQNKVDQAPSQKNSPVDPRFSLASLGWPSVSLPCRQK